MMEIIMAPIKTLSYQFLVFLVVFSLSFSGCGSYVPWFGDEADEEEDFLSFEDSEPEEEILSKEEDPFAEEMGLEEMERDQDLIEEGEGFASIDQETDEGEIKTDIESLQGQQEALIAKVRELQEVISTLEPKITATQEQLQGSLGNVSQQADYLEPEVQDLKQQVANLQSEIAALRAKRRGSPKTRSSHRGSGISIGFKKEYEKALSAYRKSQYDESILLFQSLSVKNPPISYQDNIHYWIGSNFVKLEMYDDAIKHFEAVLNQFPSGNKVHDSRYMLGVSYHRKGDNTRAMDILQSALKFQPTAEVRSKIQRELNQIQ